MKTLNVALGVAIAEATRSEHNVKHGAVLVKKGKIIQSGRNQYCGMERIRHFNSRIWSIHAEMNILAGLPRNMTRGADIMVVRVNSRGDIVNSKPCHICMSMIKNAGCRKVFYSTDMGEISSEKV
jgi:deoxycytidylate deaminase